MPPVVFLMAGRMADFPESREIRQQNQSVMAEAVSVE
jgi:hypothetical protein